MHFSCFSIEDFLVSEVPGDFPTEGNELIVTPVLSTYRFEAMKIAGSVVS